MSIPVLAAGAASLYLVAGVGEWAWFLGHLELRRAMYPGDPDTRRVAQRIHEHPVRIAFIAVLVWPLLAWWRWTS
jgi:hypothetical protein